MSDSPWPIVLAGLTATGVGCLALWWWLNNGGGGTTTCWKCVGTTPQSQTFPSGTVCGQYPANDYPAAYEPNCQPNGNNTTSVTSTCYETRYNHQSRVLPDVEVIAKNTETGVEYSDISDSSGKWVLTSLPLGVYDLTGIKDRYETYIARALNWYSPTSSDNPYFVSNMYMEYLPIYELDWYTTGDAIYSYYFDLNDEYGAAGYLTLTGQIRCSCIMLPYTWKNCDVWSHSIHGIKKLIKKSDWSCGEVVYPFVNLNETIVQDVADPIIGISVWAGGGILPNQSLYPCLEMVDLTLERIY